MLYPAELWARVLTILRYSTTRCGVNNQQALTPGPGDNLTIRTPAATFISQRDDNYASGSFQGDAEFVPLIFLSTVLALSYRRSDRNLVRRRQ